MPFQRLNKSWVHITTLVLVVLVFYAHTFDAGFVFDDYAQQEMLKLIKDDQREMNMFYFTSSPEEVHHYIQMTAIPWWTGPKWRLKYFRPVATLSHLMDHALWGSNPLPYHINNVLWYALLVVLIYLFYRLFSNHRTMAFWGAMIFALEPCHYFTVRWPASRNDIICATFLVTSFIFYIQFCRKRRPFYSMLFMTAYLLALLSKELAFLFPVLIVAYDWIRYQGLKKTIRYQWKVYLPLAVINSLHLLFYKLYDYGSYWYGETSIKSYLIEFAKATTLYLNALFYGGTIAALGPDVFDRYGLIVIFFLLILFYLLYLIWKERARYPEINLFLLWVFLLMPFIVVPPINERLLLIPSIGYAYLAALAIFRLGKKSLAIFFILTGLFLPPITNIIQARGYDEALQSNYEQLYESLDEIVVDKSPQDRLFIINFPRVGLSGENYMYLALYFNLYYQYPRWKVPVYPLSAFDDRVEVEVLDEKRIRISHPTRYYFETNTEKLFSLNRVFSEGERFSLPDATISIDEMESGKVTSVEVTFAESIDNPFYYFLYFDEGKWQRWYPQKKKDPFGK